VTLLTARKACAARTRRGLRIGTVPEPDFVGVVYGEVARFPDQYRSPVVLCELRELTIVQAAELGWAAPSLVASDEGARYSRRACGNGAVS